MSCRNWRATDCTSRYYESKHDVLRSLEKPVDDRELERIREYETEAAVLSANIAREEMQVGIANEKHGSSLLV